MNTSELSKIRIGIGHDTHRLGDGGPLILGGISIDHDKHAIGHSDADVLLHAITDAILGAACLGDIGEIFPIHPRKTRIAAQSRCFKSQWLKLPSPDFRYSIWIASCLRNAPSYLLSKLRSVRRSQKRSVWRLTKLA